MVAQLLVSSDTADREAQQWGQTTDDELLLYVIHGTLHLVGFDDHEPDDAAAMRRAEAEYLSRWNVAHRGFDSPSPEPAPPDPDVEVAG